MADSTSKEDLKLAKQQMKDAKAEAAAAAKLAKAEEATAAKAAKTEERAAARAEKEARKAAKKRGDDPQAEDGGPAVGDEMPATTLQAYRPRLELVLEPGPVKHMHWDAEERARIARLDQDTPPGEGAPAEQPPADLPAFSGRRRTLYTTDQGNQVVSYQQGGRRVLAVTENGREVPLTEERVNAVIGTQEAQSTALQETVTTTESVVDKPRRGFFRRKAVAQEPVVEHVYRRVETTDTPPAPAAQASQSVQAWEPDATLRLTTSRAARTARPARRAARKPASRLQQASKPRRAARKPKRIYPGDNHPVIDIEGIGPVYTKKLEKLGITTTGLLGIAKPGRVAKKLHVPRRTVKMWQAEAELIKVRGIGPQFAEAMARAGIKGIDELKKRKADDIAKQVAKYLRKLDATVVGQPVTPKRVARWKRKAKPMRRVKIDKKKLAVPDHGIPPPWLREGAKKATRKTARKGARKAAKKASRTSAKRVKKTSRKMARRSRRPK